MFFFQKLHGLSQESDYVYSHNFYRGKHISRKGNNKKNLVRFYCPNLLATFMLRSFKIAKTGKKLYILDFSCDEYTFR